MQNPNEVRITTRDRLLRAWENSMELVRDFETYSKEITDDDRTAKLFVAFAVDEGLHAAQLRELLLDAQRN